MFQVRPAYVPAIFVSGPGREIARVGATGLVRVGTTAITTTAPATTASDVGLYVGLPAVATGLLAFFAVGLSIPISALIGVVSGGAGYVYLNNRTPVAPGASCPTDAQVTAAVTGVQAGTTSIESATATADAWATSGCPTQAQTLRIAIVAKKAVGSAAVNWLPGCTPPAGWVAPAGWTPGALAPDNVIAGWTAPAGWRFGDALPAGSSCPPGWTSTRTPDTTTTPPPIDESYTSATGVAWTIRKTPAAAEVAEYWNAWRPSVPTESFISPGISAATRAEVIEVIDRMP